MQKIILKVFCEKCGKQAPKDTSNPNWIKYDTSKPCECGGRFIARHELVDTKDLKK